MPNLFASDLNKRADSLAVDITKQPLHQTWLIGGRWGSGKSTLLRLLKNSLKAKKLMPIVLSPPQREMDTGPAVLLQIADSLRSYGLANGELEILEKPDAKWSDKLGETLNCLNRAKDVVVLLCEETGKWAVSPTSDDAFSLYSNQHTQDVLAAIHEGVACRRVFTAPSARSNDDHRTHFLPRDTHPSRLLDDDEPWGAMAPVAHKLHARLGSTLGVATPLEIRLLVALAEITSVTEAAAYFYSQWLDCRAITQRLALEIATRQHYGKFRTLWAQLALCRELVDPELLNVLDVESLEPHEQTLLYHGLLHPRDECYELNHVLRFQETVVSWLDSEDRIATHRKLAGYYAAKLVKSKSASRSDLELELEGYHHVSRAPSEETVGTFRAMFVDQLNKLGRTYSKEFRNYEAAAAVFREAIRRDDQNDYAHHYLAYNIDWMANDPASAETEYRRAIELNPQHPWWWSRWINFLITVGRSREAREQWTQAVEALNLTTGDGPEIVYHSLHLWVARLLVHRAQLDFAEAVLSETPASIRETDLRFRAIVDLLAALREAERIRSVFPLSVPYRDRWKGPHLEFPREIDEEGNLVQWFPAQIDDVDEETVYLVMAKRDPEAGKEEYAHVEIPREIFDAASLDEDSSQIRSGRFIELAFYGVREILRIRVHPDTPWQPPGMPPLDPDPRRYLRKAGLES